MGSSLVNPDNNHLYSDEECTKLLDEFDNYKREGLIEVISFHEAYSYIDFIEGSKLDIKDGRELSGYEMNFLDCSGCFKKNAQKALFECLDIPLIKKLQIFSFDKILEYFKELYPAGSLFGLESSSFEIVRYTNKAIMIKPRCQSSVKELLYEPFEKLMTKSVEKDIQGHELKNILEPYKGSIVYYSTVHQKLIELYESAKLKLIDEYYRGSYELKKDNIKPYVLIIEEIDNANISKVFGELISLLDEDKRSKRVIRLPYSQDKFMIPDNLYILGTITTPSFMTDYKNWNILLRKFAFMKQHPNPSLVADFGCNFSEKFKILNERISLILGEEYQIGHWYFLKSKYEDADINVLKTLWFRYINPRLRLYLNKEFDKMQAILGKAKDDGSSFIKTRNFVKLPNDCNLDESNYFIYADQYTENFDFQEALDNAFN